MTEVHSALLYAYVGILIVSIFFSAPDKDLVEIGKKFWVSAYKEWQQGKALPI